MRLRELGIFFIILIISLSTTGCSQKTPYSRYSDIPKNHPTMKSYKIKDKVYHPTYVSVGDTMTGVASWYGPGFHKKQTSSCEVYNMYAHTAAHKTWPMNTMVKATCRETGKSVIVRINDRGPFVNGRVIDLSFIMGKQLGLDKKGITKIKLEVLGFAGKIDKYRTKKSKKRKKVLLTDFVVQVGSFQSLDIAKKIQNIYDLKVLDYQTNIKIFNFGNTIYYRVWISGFRSQQEAEDFVISNSINDAIILRGDTGELCKRN
jgi:rare lipoprotein A